MISYELEERIAIMNLEAATPKFIETLAAIDLNTRPKCFTTDEWEIIKTNTDKILFKLDDFIKHRWSPLDLFGVGKENGIWQGLLFRLPPKVKIIAIDNQFVDYLLLNSNEVHHLIKSYHLNAKLFWKI